MDSCGQTSLLKKEEWQKADPLLHQIIIHFLFSKERCGSGCKLCLVQIFQRINELVPGPGYSWWYWNKMTPANPWNQKPAANWRKTWKNLHALCSFLRLWLEVTWSRRTSRASIMRLISISASQNFPTRQEVETLALTKEGCHDGSLLSLKKQSNDRWIGHSWWSAGCQ